MIKLSNSLLLSLIFLIVFLKIIFYFLITNGFLLIVLGGGNDAEYYDGYATGYYSYAVNIWPVILRYLNDYSFYSRDIISFLLLFLNLILIPVLACRVAGVNFIKYQKYYLYLFMLCSIYPTVYIYTFDIYRDVFMLFIFLLSCLTVKKTLHSSNFIQFLVFFIISILLGLFLLKLRAYLGYAFIAALFLWKLKFTRKRIIFLSILYIFTLFIANYIGVFDSVTDYREGFEQGEAGSTLGLNFSNPIMFIPNLFLSMLGQLFGLYITNPFAIILFLIETVPFSFMLAYIVRNIKLADNFVRFLIMFFVLYASVWLIGNDNLGTALRLRFYNYFSVYICFFYILRLKKLYLKTS